MEPTASTSAISKFYTIERSKRTAGRSPHILTLTAAYPGDGDRSRWPKTHNDLKLLDPSDPKAILWRSKAGEWLAKELGLFDQANTCWILAKLPPGFGLFEQITQKREKDAVLVRGEGKVRLDRFVWGSSGRKIRSALSLGKHIGHLLHQRRPLQCPCDGCKSLSQFRGVVDSPSRQQLQDQDVLNDGEDGQEKRESSAGSRGQRDESEGSVERPRKGSNVPITVRRMGESSREGGEGKRVGSAEDGTNDPIRSGTKKRKHDERPGSTSMDDSPDDMRHYAPTVTLQDGSNPYQVALVDVQEDPEDEKDAELDWTWPSCSRRGELVWVHGKHVEGPGAEFGRWPGIVKSKRLVWALTDGAGFEALYTVNLLVLNTTVETADAIPYLAYVAPDAAAMMMRKGDGSKPGKFKVTNRESKKVLMAFKESEMPSGAIAQFLEAIVTARWYSQIQCRPVPTLETGRHLLIHPKRTKIMKNRSRVVSSDSRTEAIFWSPRYFRYDKLLYGAETLVVGDVVRLMPMVELPNCATRQLTPDSSAILGTSLCLRIVEFYRSGTTNSPLFARGQLFEMIELEPVVKEHVWDPEGLDRPAQPEDDDQMTEREAVSDLPEPFPYHRWRRITVDGYYVDVFASEIAGRYYTVPGHAFAKSDEVINETIKGAIELGLVGSDGFWPLQLMLGGLAPGDVPALQPKHGIEGGRDVMRRAAEERGRLGVSILYRELSRRLQAEAQSLPFPPVSPYDAFVASLAPSVKAHDVHRSGAPSGGGSV